MILRNPQDPQDLPLPPPTISLLGETPPASPCPTTQPPLPMLTDDTPQHRPRKIARRNPPNIDAKEVETPLPPHENPSPPQSPHPVVSSHPTPDSTLATTPFEPLPAPFPSPHPPITTTAHPIPTPSTIGKPLSDMVIDIIKMTSVVNRRLLQVHVQAQ